MKKIKDADIADTFNRLFINSKFEILFKTHNKMNESVNYLTKEKLCHAL